MKRIIVSVMALCVFPCAGAFAVDLTVDQKQPVLMPDGKSSAMICDDWSSDDKPVCKHKAAKTVGDVIQEVLSAQLIDPQTHGQDATNIKSGAIAIRLYGIDRPTLRPDDIPLILARVDKTEDPITIARMHQILAPEASGEK